MKKKKFLRIIAASAIAGVVITTFVTAFLIEAVNDLAGLNIKID